MEVMVDIDKRQEVIKVLYGVKKEGRQHTRRLFRQLKKLYRLNSQYDTQREEIYGVLERNDELRKNWNEEIIKARFEMKDRMNRGEWKAVFSEQ